MNFYKATRIIKYILIFILIMTVIANMPEICHWINLIKQNVKMFLYEITHI